MAAQKQPAREQQPFASKQFLLFNMELQKRTALSEMVTSWGGTHQTTKEFLGGNKTNVDILVTDDFDETNLKTVKLVFERAKRHNMPVVTSRWLEAAYLDIKVYFKVDKDFFNEDLIATYARQEPIPDSEKYVNRLLTQYNIKDVMARDDYQRELGTLEAVTKIGCNVAQQAWWEAETGKVKVEKK